MLEQPKTKTRKLRILAALLIIITAVFAAGTAYARYQKSVEREVTLVVQGITDFQMSILQDWTRQESGAERAIFAVSNQGAAEDAYFTVRLGATQGFVLDGAKISLIVTNNAGVERVYEGTAVAYGADSTLYQQMGPGYEYIFCGSDGEEMIWNLAGGQTSEQQFTVQVEGATSASLVKIMIAETKQSE